MYFNRISGKKYVLLIRWDIVEIILEFDFIFPRLVMCLKCLKGLMGCY